MIYLELFLGFLRVGCFAFGGAYGAIPLIREVVLSYGWLEEETLTYLIAVSESTPGPIMVNLATYVGSTQAGLGGAFLATLAVVLPSFILILLITSAMAAVADNPCVKAVLAGLKPCITGVILATGVCMVLIRCRALEGRQPVDLRAAGITAALGLVLIISARVKKKLSPVKLILLAACMGLVVYGL